MLPNAEKPIAAADHSAATDSGVAVAGSQNIVITGDVSGSITITIGGRDVRADELAYLDGLIAQYRYWAEKYTPLAGIAEVRAAATNGPRLDLPMLFMPAGFEKLEEHGFGEQRRVERVPVDDLRDAVARYRRLVLLGEPGSGKTTTLWRLAYDTAVTAQADPRAPLPLLVPLGGYAGDESPLHYDQDFFGALAQYLPAYLQSGRVVLLLDALNEMPQRGYRERVVRIQALLDTYPDAPVVITCRVLDYVETLRLEKLEVKPLDPERQRAYLHRYLGETDGEKLFWQLAGGDAVANLWHTWQSAGGSWAEFWTAERMPQAVYSRTTSEQDRLWEQLRRSVLPPLLALGSNPFMLVMLAQVYAAGGGVLPTNRGKLFAAFVDTLLRREERRCEPANWPGAELIRRSLSRLAFAMQRAGERGTAVDTTWAAKQVGQDASDPQQVLYLAASATLLDTSSGRVRFVHQLVQEYFAALALGECVAAGDDLRPYWRGGWIKPSGWEETTVLLAGIVPDMTGLVERLLLAKPGLAARCVADSGGVRPAELTIRAIQHRLVDLATGCKANVQDRNAAADALNWVGDPRPGVGSRADGLPDIAWCDVPAGEFVMGDGIDLHTSTTISPYSISKNPITNAQYAAFVQDGGYTERWRHCWTKTGWSNKDDQVEPAKRGAVYDLPNHPVVMVTWYEAHAFCNWLSEKLRLEVTLPSEAQWEKAARGTDGREYPWNGAITPDHANYDDTGIHATSAVGIFPRGASPYGALDMSGNVWEWCRTKWRSDYEMPEDNDPNGADTRVLRGGAFVIGAGNVRCAVRHWNYPNYRYSYFGFRVVALALPEGEKGLPSRDTLDSGSSRLWPLGEL